MLWERLDTGVSHGRNSLVRFAVHLLSIITNSASCEWAFSEFGITHTKRRNWLSEEKVHKTTMVKMDLQRDQMEAGLLPTRKWWHFSHFKSSTHPDLTLSLLPLEAETGDSEDMDTENAPRSFTQLIHEIIATESWPSPEVLQASSAFGSNCIPISIPLKDLFDYNVSVDTDYWIGGFRGLDDEMARYDLSAESAAAASNIP